MVLLTDSGDELHFFRQNLQIVQRLNTFKMLHSVSYIQLSKHGHLGIRL